MDELRAAGDVLVVVRLDRLARAVSHLLQVIEDIEERGVHFRSIRDPINTSTPQGMFSLQVLGAVAQLERALIAERTKAGIKAAKAREKLYLDELISSAQTWLPTVGSFARNTAGTTPWGSSIARGHDWTVERTAPRSASNGPREAGRSRAPDSLAPPCARGSSEEDRCGDCHFRSRLVATRHCRATGSRPLFVTCWTRHIGSVSSAIEDAVHQLADGLVSCAPFF